MEEKYYDFFHLKLAKLPVLRQYHSSIDNPEFEKWWGSITFACERMGLKYKQRANRIHFYPQIFISDSNDDDDNARINETYQSGLNQAEAFLETLIEELQTWGLDDNSSRTLPSNNGGGAKSFNLYLTISQHQAQQIAQTINLKEYDEDTRKKVNDLLIELNKKDKDKSKIADIIKWLADKSIDALIAILIAKINLT